jgi:predicted molibdopterin-dependent oxidoreductase YjgC
VRADDDTGQGDRPVSLPLVKRAGNFVEVSWDQVIKYVASTLIHYKGDQFAGISSAKCTNEENYLFQKFVRAVMGTNNVDHCARL